MRSEDVKAVENGIKTLFFNIADGRSVLSRADLKNLGSTLARHWTEKQVVLIFAVVILSPLMLFLLAMLSKFLFLTCFYDSFRNHLFSKESLLQKLMCRVSKSR